MRTAKATPEEWLKAIGVDASGTRIPALMNGEAGIELPMCCANVSTARDILIGVMTTGKLYERDVEYLCYCLEGHDLPDSPILTRICDDLGVKLNFWSQL